MSHDYASCREQAKRFYDGLGSVRCPALKGASVRFNNKGFNHLIRKSRIRPRREQVNRFVLLPYAKPILENPRAVVAYRTSAQIQYWTFIEEVVSPQVRLKLKVVVRQVAGGAKHFYSIMSSRLEKQKTLS